MAFCRRLSHSIQRALRESCSILLRHFYFKTTGLALGSHLVLVLGQGWRLWLPVSNCEEERSGWRGRCEDLCWVQVALSLEWPFLSQHAHPIVETQCPHLLTSENDPTVLPIAKRVMVPIPAVWEIGAGPTSSNSVPGMLVLCTH